MSAQDKYMPEFDAREHHELIVPGSPERAYAAFREVDLSDSLLVRTLFGLRTLPALVQGQPWGTPKGPFVEQALTMGWVVLEESPGSEFVVGAVTEPWASVVEFTGIPPQEFRSFAEPGFVKIVWGFSAKPSGDQNSLLGTETRAQATDPEARAKFRRYWLFVSPGIRLIRWVALRLARRKLVRTKHGSGAG